MPTLTEAAGLLLYEPGLFLPRSLPLRPRLPLSSPPSLAGGCRIEESWSRTRNPTSEQAGLADCHLPSWCVVQGFPATGETRQTNIRAHV